MKNLILFSIALALMIAAGATFASGVVGKSINVRDFFSGPRARITESIAEKTHTGSAADLSRVKEITIPGSGNVRIRVDEKAASGIQMNGDGGAVIAYEVKGEELVITQALVDQFSRTSDYDITLASLEQVRILGSGHVDIVEPFAVDEFGIEILGSGSVKANVTADSLDVKIIGSGDVDIDGTTENLSLTILGPGNFIAGDLNGESAEISIMGSGDSRIGNFEELKATIAGSGDLTYSGHPKIESKSPGSGKLIAE